MRYLPILIFAILAVSAEAQDDFKGDFLSKWQNAKEYTLEVARLMPADMYDYKPTEEQRAFHEQLTHACANMIWLSTSYLDGPGLATADEEHPPTSKEEVLKLLEESFDYVDSVVRAFDMADIDTEIEFFAGPMSKRKVFFLITDHLTHHRGQMIVYLRLNDIEPPRYRGW